MNEVVIYLLKVITIHGLLYLFYRMVLRNTGRHTFNRGYLLTALIAAFFIPLIELSLPEKHPILEEGSVIFWLEPSSGWEEFELIPVQKESTQSYWYLLPWMYVVIALALTVRSAFYLAMLRRLKKQSQCIKKRWFTLFKISQDRPFSFFSNVFMPKSLFGTEAFEQILTHECEHVRQLHSVDRLLTDFVVSLFWFNPFMYLYRNALIEIHEFQADEVVIRRFKDPVGYQETLFSQLQSAQYSGLVSHFNFSMIKKRIVMMNKQRKMSGWVYALTAPVTLMIVFAFSSKEAVAPIAQVGNEIAELLGPDPGIGAVPFWNLPNPKVETQKGKEVQGNVPSISPIRESDLNRLSSGFGMRMHPIYKVKKFHSGADFSCKTGTEVMATADGKVVEVRTNEEGVGYGKMVIIEHGGGYETRYAQLSAFKVKEGDEVKQGDVIALSGNSGQSTAPHLHYEVKKDGEFVNPVYYIKDYTLKLKSSDGEESDSDRYDALRMQEEELAQREMMLAKEEAERAEVEQMKAEEMQRAASGQEQKAYRMQLEAEEMRQMAERIAQEKLRFEDGRQERTVRIRGTGKDPLYVVDGKVVEDLTEMGPSDIDRIDVLKGEDATSKYGSKAKDGAIEITTKGKQKDKSKTKDKSKDKGKDKDTDKEKNPQLSKAEIIKAQKALSELGFFESKESKASN